MSNNLTKQWSAENAKIKPFEVLVGRWKTTGAHPLRPGVTLRGFVSFEWIEAGAFLLMRSEIDEEGFPSGTVIIGCDDASETGSMLYFDERGVARIFQSSFSGKIWKAVRIAPGFSQRFTHTVSDDNNTVSVLTELSKDDSTWARDLEQTWSRIRA